MIAIKPDTKSLISKVGVIVSIFSSCQALIPKPSCQSSQEERSHFLFVSAPVSGSTTFTPAACASLAGTRNASVIPRARRSSYLSSLGRNDDLRIRRKLGKRLRRRCSWCQRLHQDTSSRRRREMQG